MIPTRHSPTTGPASSTSFAAGERVPLKTTLPLVTVTVSGDQPAACYAVCDAPASFGAKHSQNPQQIQQFEKGCFTAALAKHHSQLFRKPSQINEFERQVPRKETKKTKKTTPGVMHFVMHP